LLSGFQAPAFTAARSRLIFSKRTSGSFSKAAFTSKASWARSERVTK
jgi:hypothetical protein